MLSLIFLFVPNAIVQVVVVLNDLAVIVAD